jgi:hypothetical protein
MKSWIHKHQPVQKENWTMTPNTILVVLTTIIVLLALMLPISACTVHTDTSTLAPTAALPEAAEATATLKPASTPTEIAPTQTAAPTLTPADSVGQRSALVTVDISGVAQDLTSQVVAPVLASADVPWWAAIPQHMLLMLQGYPIKGHPMEPQLFVYPIQGLGTNEAAVKVAEDLQALLQDRQVGDSMPYLPLYNAAQVIHAQVKYLDFENGQGVRFLTWYSQGIMPINSHGLLYTYQGLTSDGRYYVAAVLPVNLPALPADEQDPGNLSPDFSNNYLKYLADTVANLEQQADDAYTPDLRKLDAMVQSIEIK